MRTPLRFASLAAALSVLPLACSTPPAPADVVSPDAPDAGPAGDAMDAPPADAPPACTPASCSGAGRSCRGGACVEDCRPSDAVACGAGTVCDFTDGRCRAATEPCVLTGAFQPCPGGAIGDAQQCGPGLACNGRGACISTNGCSGLDCDASGRCWGRTCPCERPAARCAPAPLEQLNRAEFVGSTANMRDQEGIFDLEFDDVCTAYAVTVISGTDYLRQMLPSGEFSQWPSVSNLDMGEVAVLRLPGGEFGTSLGDVAATYICNAGCTPTSEDGRLGVIRLDRASAARPLPNVLPAESTTGAGPFGDPVVDSGPYGLTWGRDDALYVGNVRANGDFVRVDLAAGTSMTVATLPARVVAANVYDAGRLLVAVEGGAVFLVANAGGAPVPWATLPGDATSLARDEFTGNVYAEVRTTPPRIVEVRGDGTGMVMFQAPPRLGRIAIAPDNYLYHASVYPRVGWMAGDTIVRWRLPPRR